MCDNTSSRAPEQPLPPASTPLRCRAPNCTKPASLFCPTCAKLGLPRAVGAFCAQACFKRAWQAHKLSVHVAAAANAPETTDTNSAAAAAAAAADGDADVTEIPDGCHDPFAPPKFKYTGRLRAVYPLSERRAVPPGIPLPDYAMTGIPASEHRESRSFKIEVLKPDEIKRMRAVCELARQVLDVAAAAIAPGVTTDEIDAVVHRACVERGAYPSPLNYMGFPKSVCTSVNEVICHGIPDRRALKVDDIVNIDVSIYKDGFHADLNETYAVSPQHVGAAARRVADAAREALRQAIAAVRPGTMYRELGGIIERVARERGVAVNRTYCGHGIHRLFHCAPSVPHYKDNKAVGVMKPGHVFTIEPMLCEGDAREIHWPDAWTAVTRDGRLSAQFEHTLLVTDTGCEVLTRALGGAHDVVLDGLRAEQWGEAREAGEAREEGA